MSSQRQGAQGRWTIASFTALAVLSLTIFWSIGALYLGWFSLELGSITIMSTGYTYFLVFWCIFGSIAAVSFALAFAHVHAILRPLSSATPDDHESGKQSQPDQEEQAKPGSGRRARPDAARIRDRVGEDPGERIIEVPPGIAVPVDTDTKPRPGRHGHEGERLARHGGYREQVVLCPKRLELGVAEEGDATEATGAAGALAVGHARIAGV